MFLGVFRSQQPANFFLVPAIALVFWLPVIFRNEPVGEPADAMPLYSMLIQVFSVFPPWLYRIVTLLLIVAEAFYLNHIINKHEVLYKPSFLPALMYVLLMSFSRHAMWMHPMIWGNLFLIASLDKALALFKNPNPTRDLFDSSLLTGLVFLLYAPGIIFYLHLVMSLFIIRTPSFRQWLITLIGFVLPFYFACVYYFLTDSLGSFLQTFPWKILNLRMSNEISWSGAFITQSILLISIVVLSLVKLRGNFYKNTIRTRIHQRVFVYLSIASAVSLLFVPRIDAWHLAPLALSFSVFTGYYFLVIRKRMWIADVMFAALFVTILWNQI